MTSLAPYLNKKYILVSSDDKFDELMKALGIGFLFRSMVHVTTPVDHLTEHDGEYTLTTETRLRNLVTKFRLGEKFDCETADGRQIECCFTVDENKLIQVQDGDKRAITVREFSPEELKVTIKVDDHVSIRIYKLIK